MIGKLFQIVDNIWYEKLYILWCSDPNIKASEVQEYVDMFYNDHSMSFDDFIVELEENFDGAMFERVFTDEVIAE